MKQSIYQTLQSSAREGQKRVALLIDPDKFDPATTPGMAANSGADLIFIGGSLLSGSNLEETVVTIKQKCKLPVVLFPGNILQISARADALLNLSLISGRNAELLIGQHVIAAPVLKASNLEIIPTGYMLIDSGRQTAASYISGTSPIPYDKDEIAVCTALAGEQLGLKMIYLEAGSGAQKTVSPSMIRKVKQQITIPLIVGGGIRDTQTAISICEAGADLIVIGNAAESDYSLVREISDAIHKIHQPQ